MTEQIPETSSEDKLLFITARRNERMGKLMFSLRHEYLRTITLEARSRGISVQELLRAVIIPDWVREREERRADALRARTAPSEASSDRRRWSD